MNGDYHTPQDLDALYTIFDTAAAANEIDDLRSLLKFYEKRATDYRKRGGEKGAEAFDEKAAAVRDELKRLGYEESDQ